MTRILTTFAAFIILCLLVTIAFGFWSMSLGKDEFWLDIYFVHFCLGLFTSIAILLVHSIIFIYFLGTGRLVKEVGIAYRLPDEPLLKLTRELKREAFPAALFSMLIGIATAAAGMGRQMGEWHWSIHLVLAFATLAINLWAFKVEYRCVSTNAGVIDNVFIEIDRIRAEQGLVSNAQALKEEGLS